MHNASGFLLFLIGLGASYRIQIVGAIGISEIFVFLWAPFLFWGELPHLRRNGFARYLGIWFLTVLGCVVSSIVNRTDLPLFLRGFAQIYSLFAGVVVIHFLLRKNISSIRWLALGLCLSPVLSFLLHGGDLSMDFDMTEEGMKAFRRMSALSHITKIPVACWYFNSPLWFSAGLPIVFGIVCIMSSASGRSLALTLIATGMLALIGWRKPERIFLISKHFVRFCIYVVLVVFIVKTAYVKLAPKGFFGESIQRKFLAQTGGNTSTIALLMGGRPQFLSGAYVASKKPILGFGPWYQEWGNGYEAEFYQKYASPEASDYYFKSLEERLNRGKSSVLGGHSHLIAFWTWYGIFGLLFWLYVLCQLALFFKNNICKIPVFFGFICAYAPKFVWDAFFSPYSARMQTSALIVLILMANSACRSIVSKPVIPKLQ